MSDSNEFVVLRARYAPGSVGGIRLLGMGPSAENSEPSEVSVSMLQLDAQQRAELQREPSVFGIARSMPTKLIRSFPVEAEAAAVPSWGIAAVGADRSGFNGAGIKVAILDTGIDRSHPAFAGVSLTEVDFTGSGNGDVQGHGTHCAGTVFGRDVAGQRIGVARGITEALIGKVLDNNGSGTSGQMFDAMKWASANGAKVISMSLGFDYPGLVARLVDNNWPIEKATSRALEDYRDNLRVLDSLLGLFAAQAAMDGGSLVIAASGNESTPQYRIAAGLPAAATGVIAVGAVQAEGAKYRVTSFSNSRAQIAAPGLEIVSARVGGGVQAMSGTSMACPHVAGVAALWWQAIHQMPIPKRASLVQSKLIAAARSNAFVAQSSSDDYGAGLVVSP